MTMSFDETPDFKHEFKRYLKKYRSLVEDLDELKYVLKVRPLGQGRHFNVLARQGDVSIVKARLFCSYLKKSTLRIIYACHEKESRFVFLELYFKGDKGAEDKTRIRDYMASPAIKNTP